MSASSCRHTFPSPSADAAALLEWARRRGTPVPVRLVKGAIGTTRRSCARLMDGRSLCIEQKWESDANFEHLTRFLMENYQWLRPALGSHNLRSLSHAITWLGNLACRSRLTSCKCFTEWGPSRRSSWPIAGHRVRIYTPFGELIPGMAYLVRRLLENTSNDSFLRQSFTEHIVD